MVVGLPPTFGVAGSIKVDMSAEEEYTIMSTNGAKGQCRFSSAINHPLICLGIEHGTIEHMSLWNQCTAEQRDQVWSLELGAWNSEKRKMTTVSSICSVQTYLP